MLIEAKGRIAVTEDVKCDILRNLLASFYQVINKMHAESQWFFHADLPM